MFIYIYIYTIYIYIIYYIYNIYKYIHMHICICLYIFMNFICLYICTYTFFIAYHILIFDHTDLLMIVLLKCFFLNSYAYFFLILFLFFVSLFFFLFIKCAYFFPITPKCLYIVMSHSMDHTPFFYNELFSLDYYLNLNCYSLMTHVVT